MKSKFVYVAIIGIALLLRVYGINWDQGQHLHPDERFLTMVVSSAKIPHSFSDYLDPAKSTLNPYNLNYSFFVYGTFPITFVKLLAVHSGLDSYDGIVYLGRLISALLDVGTLILLMLLVRVWQKRSNLHPYIHYVVGFLYAFAVFPIQQSHFFTTDTFTQFFTIAALYLVTLGMDKKNILYTIFAAVCVGLAIASKVSAIFFLPLIAAVFIYGFFKRTAYSTAMFGEVCLHTLIAMICTYVALRIGDPRIFMSGSFLNIIPNPQFLANIAELKRLTDLNGLFPPNIQWISKTKILFPLKNIFMYGVGLPYAALALFGLVALLRKSTFEIRASIVWCVGFLIYTGMQNVMTMRYFYCLYPFLALYAAEGFFYIGGLFGKRTRRFSYALLLIIVAIWPLAFMSIYSAKHSRVQASEWIYQNIPAGSTIATEHWDDGLPLSLAAQPGKPAKIAQQYQFVELPVFDPDSEQKKMILAQKLSQADYYIMSSNRAYGSISSVPTRYPFMAQFYTDLFAEKLEYAKIAEITSYPTLHLGFTEIIMNDDGAEEGFSVYDHPKVLIYENQRK